MNAHAALIQLNLHKLVRNLQQQSGIGGQFPDEMQSLPEQLAQIVEHIDSSGEFGLAYESIVCLLEQFPFVLDGTSAIALLEIGLLMRYKTDRPVDIQFDSRT